MKPIYAVFALPFLAACDPTITNAGLQCALDINARVVSGELERGSLAYQQAIVLCGSPVATMAALDQLSEADG